MEYDQNALSLSPPTRFFFRRKGFPHGTRSLELPIKVKNGPQTVVLLRSNVTSPEVELSHEELDFDSVLVGQGKAKYIQVTWINESDDLCCRSYVCSTEMSARWSYSICVPFKKNVHFSTRLCAVIKNCLLIETKTEYYT